jgi:hypothetical protein
MFLAVSRIGIRRSSVSKKPTLVLPRRGATLHMVDQIRMDRIRLAFQHRGLGGLALVAKIRILIDEWLRSENGNPKK